MEVVPIRGLLVHDCPYRQLEVLAQLAGYKGEKHEHDKMRIYRGNWSCIGTSWGSAIRLHHEFPRKATQRWGSPRVRPLGLVISSQAGECWEERGPCSITV